MPPESDWLMQFRPFSWVHLAAAVVSIGAMAVVVGTGLRRRGTAAERRVGAIWGWSILLFQGAAGAWWLLPANFEAQRSIPLNLCRLAAFIAAAAMLTEWRWARTLLYFWGLGLCTQALITPVFPEGPGRVLFWVFWIGHTQIVGSALYDLVVRRYRPTAPDFRLTLLISFLYAAIVFAIDAASGLNYAALGRTVFDAPNLARRLGPWPWRAVWIVAIAMGWMTLFWLAWRPWRAGSEPGRGAAAAVMERPRSVAEPNPPSR